MKSLCALPHASSVKKRLKKESLAVTVAGKNIFEMTDMSVKDLYSFIDQMQLTPIFS